jgi:hypothetical protein
MAKSGSIGKRRARENSSFWLGKTYIEYAPLDAANLKLQREQIFTGLWEMIRLGEVI